MFRAESGDGGGRSQQASAPIAMEASREERLTTVPGVPLMTTRPVTAPLPGMSSAEATGYSAAAVTSLPGEPARRIRCLPGQP